MTEKRTWRVGRLAAWLCVGWASVLAAGEAGSETPGAVGAPSRSRSIVGAIRWDAWHGDAGLQGSAQVFPVGPQRETPGLAVERSLGPAHWHYRLPFYARVVGENQVEIRGNSQDVMDREIVYASGAGLDYWAFLTYRPDSPMTIGLNLYLASERKSQIKFCIICHHVRPDDPAEIERLVNYMADDQYVTVLGGRPLVYAFQCGRGNATFYERLIQAALDAGLKQPYLVDMGQSPGVPADARSGYLGGSVPAVWDRWKAEGYKVIPHVSAGFDRRPRVENPVPWESNFGNPRPVQGGRLRTAEQAAADIASGVKNALDWNRANREAGEANAIIIYAWNEFDEGGWICPTLSEGTARLDAIGSVLTCDPSGQVSANATVDMELLSSGCPIFATPCFPKGGTAATPDSDRTGAASGVSTRNRLGRRKWPTAQTDSAWPN